MLAALAVLLAWPGGARADISPTEGVPFTDTVATLSVGCPSEGRPPNLTFDCARLNPTATISWGDGTDTDTNVSVVAANANGESCADQMLICTYKIVGTHTYSFAGTYMAVATLSNGQSSSNEAQFTATVADAPLTLSNGAITRSGQDGSGRHRRRSAAKSTPTAIVSAIVILTGGRPLPTATSLHARSADHRVMAPSASPRH